MIVINNYCVYSNKFFGIGVEFVVFDFFDENCMVVVDYIVCVSKDKGEVMLSVDNNWLFVLISSKIKLDICFEILLSDKVI